MKSLFATRPFWKTFLVLIPLITGTRFLAAQSITDYSNNLTSSINSLMQQYPANPKSPVIISANLYLGYGAILPGVDTQTLLDYVDGLKAAGAQRIDLNPAINTVNTPALAAKYDAIVQHIRELGLQLAINPEFDTTEAPVASFQDFETLAMSTYQQMASRYQPDRFVIVHEPDTQAGRMGVTTTPDDWNGFINMVAPVIKKASPATLVGAGCFYGARPNGQGNNSEDNYFQSFAANPTLDFLTMDVYTDDPASIAKFASWASLAKSNNKIVYMEETARPQFLPTTLPANWQSEPDEAIAVFGSGYSAFAPLDAQWLGAMTAFASANGMEAMTYFQTNTLFLYVSSGTTQATNPTYIMALIAAVPSPQTTIAQAASTTTPTSTSTALLTQSQQLGMKQVTSLSNASYPTIDSIYNANCGSSSDPCNANTTIAPDSLVSAFGTDLATGSAVSSTFPTTLNGTTITIVDSNNASYKAQIYSVSANQVNYLVPSNAASGRATITVTSGDGVVTKGIVYIQPVAPGLYTASSNGKGAAAAIAITTHSNGSQSSADVFSCSGGTCTPVPISLGSSSDIVALELFGTGIRHLSSAAAVSATINNQALKVLYAGPQPTTTGLDQINLELPSSLAGSGQVNLTLSITTSDGTTVALNPVTIDIQ